MARVPIPDPGAVLEAVAGRVDSVEATVAVLGRDVTALGHALGDINAALRDLAAPTPAPPGEPGDREEMPRDWIEVIDPHSAVDWLTELHVWVETRFQLLTDAYEHLPPCWPWHPKAVVELQACRAARAAAYAAGAWPVIEFEHRHLPDTLAVVTKVMTSCERAEGHHAISNWRFHYDLHALPALAAWWTRTWDRHQQPTADWVEPLHAAQADCRDQTGAAGPDDDSLAAVAAAAAAARQRAARRPVPADEASVLALVAEKVADLPPGLKICIPRAARRNR